MIDGAVMFGVNMEDIGLVQIALIPENYLNTNGKMHSRSIFLFVFCKFVMFLFFLNRLDFASWGYRRNIHVEDIFSTKEIIKQLASTVAFGGNFLLNIGPRTEGMIDSIFVERLTEIGDWLEINGEAIYGTTPWRAQNESDYAYYTSTNKTNESVIFCIFVHWPVDSHLILFQPVPTDYPKISMLGFGSLNFTQQESSTVVDLTPISFSNLPSHFAWTLVLTGFV